MVQEPYVPCNCNQANLSYHCNQRQLQAACCAFHRTSFPFVRLSKSPANRSIIILEVNANGS